MTDINQIAKSLSDAQRRALDWLSGGRRQWLGGQYCEPSEPSIAALDALVRKGLARKEGGAGWSIYYTPTDTYRALRTHLKGLPND